MIRIIDIPHSEIEMLAIRASGPGGQHVNKVASAIHLRFDVNRSSLPLVIKQRLLDLSDVRLTQAGVIVIKAQKFRSQEKNREDALKRLEDLLTKAQRTKKTRQSTRPTRGSVKRRLDGKRKQGQRKKLRGKVSTE